MSEYEINNRHERGEDVSKMPSGVGTGSNNNNSSESSGGGGGWMIWIGILVVINLLSWIFNWNFWLY